MTDRATDPNLAIPAFLDKNKSAAPVDGGHAVLSPSSSERWMKCAGSVRLSANLPNSDSEYAQEGTDAHQLAAHCLIDGSDAWEHIGTEVTREARGGKPPTKFTVSKDMADAVQVYLDYARENVLADGPNNYRVETRFDLRDIVPQNWGTSDLVGYKAAERLLRVVDYKHGIGVPVEAEDNSQLKNYAAGAVHELSSTWPDVDEVELVIVQPRAFHSDGPIRTWRIKVDQLGEWVTAELKPAAERALAPDSKIGPTGDHCRWCPAKLICPLQKEAVETAATARPEEVGPMEDFELSAAAEKIAGLKAYIHAIEDEIYRRLMKGGKVPGWKVVAKKADRVWKPEAEAELVKAFKDDAWEKKLLSPAKVEKLRGGKDIAAKYAFKPDNGLTLAPEDDKRPAVPVRTAADAFANVKVPKG